MSKRGGGGSAKGNSFRVTLAMPVGAVMNCADNTGAKTLYVVAVNGIIRCFSARSRLESNDCLVKQVDKLDRFNIDAYLS